MVDPFAEMQGYAVRADWTGLERCFRVLLRERHVTPTFEPGPSLPGLEAWRGSGAVIHTGIQAEEDITAVDLADYEAALTVVLAAGYERAQQTHARAAYFEYDIDNDWRGTLFLCDAYRPERDGDDDWACGGTEMLPGPDLPAFTRLYEEHGDFSFDENEAGFAATLYLIARTVAAFGRTVSSLPRPRFAVCIGYHDQGRLTRIFEPPPWPPASTGFSNEAGLDAAGQP